MKNKKLQKKDIITKQTILIESATEWRPDRGCQNSAIVIAIAQRRVNLMTEQISTTRYDVGTEPTALELMGCTRFNMQYEVEATDDGEAVKLRANGMHIAASLARELEGRVKEVWPKKYVPKSVYCLGISKICADKRNIGRELETKVKNAIIYSQTITQEERLKWLGI